MGWYIASFLLCWVSSCKSLIMYQTKYQRFWDDEWEKAWTNKRTWSLLFGRGWYVAIFLENSVTDISMAVHWCAQYLHNPWRCHEVAVKSMVQNWIEKWWNYSSRIYIGDQLLILDIIVKPWIAILMPTPSRSFVHFKSHTSFLITMGST